ncbi:MAG: DUF2220 family protein [Desulfobacterium sp.]|jgi:hypothetical protein|nr:DUF2220 family protein [Desulfobacterium sp.]
MKHDPFAVILIDFCNKGSIPASRLKSKKMHLRLQPLMDAGVIVQERSGAGQRWRVRDQDGLDRFSQSQFPSGLEPLAASSCVPRNRCVLYTKDAHGSKSSHLPLFVRGFKDARLTWGDRVLPVAGLTSLTGGAGFRLGRDSQWSFQGTVVTVENSEVLFHIEKVIPETCLAVYTGGRISNLLLQWLSSDAMEKAVFIHAGDYDPVGLQDYLRLSEACPGRVSLYMPDNLETLFARYANQRRLEDQSAVLKTLRSCNVKSRKNRDFLKIMHLMDRYNGGVDQEALLTHPEFL